MDYRLICFAWLVLLAVVGACDICKEYFRRVPGTAGRAWFVVASILNTAASVLVVWSSLKT